MTVNRNKIKIAYLIDEVFLGGTEKQLIETLSRLDREAFTPYLVCLRPSLFFDRLPLDCQKIVLHVSSLKSRAALGKWLWMVRWIREQGIDLLQTYFFDANLFGILAGKASRRVKILSCRRDMGYWYTPRLLWWLKRLHPFVDRVLVNSRAIKDKVAKEERVPEGKIDILPNGVDLTLFERTRTGSVDEKKRKIGIPDGSPVVGIVANLNRPVKRVDLFVRAAALIHERLPQVHFVVLGKGRFQQTLEKLAEDLGVGSHIRFLGQKEDVPSWLALMDVGCLTSDSEGFPNAILEYMAAGLPVVATSGGGVGELVEDGKTGFLVPSADVEGLARALIRLLEQPDMRTRLGTHARRIVEQRYAWPRVIEQLEDYYRGLLAGRNT